MTVPYGEAPDDGPGINSVGQVRAAKGESSTAEAQIEWTDATWNPVAGCSIITAGCTNCYALEMARRLDAMGVEKYAGLTRRSGGRTTWNGVVREDRDALAIPYGWKKPRKIFVNSMSDLFHERVSDAFFLAVWQVMRETPHHNYQILTKRPERMVEVVSTRINNILPNVWLGTSVENSEVVDRVDRLRATPAAIRFISFEPLIGPVGHLGLTGIHWAIVGGECGKSARPLARNGSTRSISNASGAARPFSSSRGVPGAKTTSVARRMPTAGNIEDRPGTRCRLRRLARSTSLRTFRTLSPKRT